MSAEGGAAVARVEPFRRIAAIVAIVALVASAVLAIVAIADNIGGVILVVIGVSIGVHGGWRAVSRRERTTRVWALIVVVFGVVVIVIGIISADLTLGRAIAIFATAALSVGAAKVAMGTTVKALRAAGPAGDPVSAATHGVLIMNPWSGGGKVEKFSLVDECRARGIEPVVLQKGDNLLELAERAIANGADVVGIAGGDGSQALVASVASRHDIPHVVIPAGTRNHFALDLGLDREDVVGALDAYADAVERRIDLATINGRIFVNNASLGLYAKIVQSPEYRDAKLQTAADMLPDLLGPDAVPLDLRYVGPDGEPRETAQMLLVSNNAYRLDQQAGSGTRERMDGGVLGVASLTVSGPADVQKLLGLNATGRIRRFPGWLEWTTTRFQVDSEAPVEVGVDGEALMLDPPLVFETKPGVLRVRIPSHALGVSPAGRSPSLLAMQDVWLRALGRA
jgi:diacylglycerol kinase family enzyme